MSRDTAPGLTLADVIDEPATMTAEEQLAEYERRSAMKDALTAVELKHLHSSIVKIGHDQFKHHERSRALLTEIRDSMRDMAKPDATQDAMLVEMRAVREFMKDAVEALNTLVAMKTNGHAH